MEWLKWRLASTVLCDWCIKTKLKKNPYMIAIDGRIPREEEKSAVVFIDLERAYDRVPRDEIWWVLNRRSVISKSLKACMRER